MRGMKSEPLAIASINHKKIVTGALLLWLETFRGCSGARAGPGLEAAKLSGSAPSPGGILAVSIALCLLSSSKQVDILQVRDKIGARHTVVDPHTPARSLSASQSSLAISRGSSRPLRVESIMSPD